MPRIQYKSGTGKLLKGSTTIAKNVGWGIGGLMYWANKMGLQGTPLWDAYDTATGPGSAAHWLIARHLKGEDLPMPEKVSEAEIVLGRPAFENFLVWEKRVKFEPIHIEKNLTAVWNDGHQVHEWGGTPDIIGMVEGERCIVDWKTGKIYPNTLIQQASYGMLNDYNFAEPIEGYHILRIPKNVDTPTFQHSYFKSLDKAANVFTMCLQLDALHDELKQMV